jgi:hypothetical protein
VHWLSDVIAGLAFGWAWFAVCAIAFGGRFLHFAAPVEKATRIAGDASQVVEVALDRPEEASASPRHPR